MSACLTEDDTKPHEIQNSQMPHAKVTVCSGFWADVFMDPYFFENDVNGGHCMSPIIKSFWPELNYLNNNVIWFHQHGAR